MKLLISHKSKKEFKDFLNKLNISYVETIDNPNLDKRIADHPDLSVFVLDKNNIIVDKYLYSYYKDKFKNINIIKGESVKSNYPFDSIYNIVKLNNYYIHNDYTESKIVKYFNDNNYNFIKVKQGYTRCSSIVLNNSIMTADYGIYKKLKNKVDTVLLNQEEIELDGFENGFLGGTCGMIDGKCIIFNGDISLLQSYDIINRKCDEENIQIFYPKCELLDTGSIMQIG